MTSTGLKVAALSVVLLALGMVQFSQHSRINRLTAEAAALQAQLSQAVASSKEGEPLVNEQPRTDQALAQGQLQELLRLRGEVGVLRRQLVEATKTDTTRKAAFHAEDAQLPSQSQVQTNQDLAADDALLTTQEQKLDEAKQKVADLLLTLNVPEELTNTDAATGLRSESLRQYWPYFQARNEFEDMERYTAIVRLKVWQDHGAQGSLGGALSQ